MPRRLCYWTVLRLVKAGYWDAAGFASKENLRLIKELDWRYVFGLARTWKLEDGTYLKDLANHLPRKRYRRVASYNPARRRRDYSRLCAPREIEDARRCHGLTFQKTA